MLTLGPPDGPGELWDEVPPARFPKRVLRFRNQRHAERVGLGELSPEAWEAHFARFEPLPDNLPRPLALRYHGHQFRMYNPRLGDGRGFLHAQLRGDDGRLLDLGTKGSGTTPWSRGGDGRLTLKGGVREVLATEMLEALGVETSKSFSLFETGEELWRGDEPSPTRSSVLVRLSHSHVRVGTFQRLLAHKDTTRMRALVRYVCTHLLGVPDDPAALLAETTRRAARTTAGWMIAGFVHGVLNTDNLNVTGESFDYGPWRFLPAYDPEFVAAYFDEVGLYCYGRQPEAVHWNLERLRDALSLLGPLPDDLHGAFERALQDAVREKVLWRLGLTPLDRASDDAVVAALFNALEEIRVPFDRLFADGYGGEARAARVASGPFARAYTSPAWDKLRAAWRNHRPAHPERLDDPRWDRPVSMVITEVEAVWDAIARDDDWGPFERKVAEVRGWGELLAPSPPVTSR